MPKPDWRGDPPPDLHAFWLVPLIAILLFIAAVLFGMR